jgi:hypothetical protein
MTAGDLLRGTLRLLWYALRLPALTFLVILEPIVRFFLGALALLGVSHGIVLQVLRRAALSLCPHARRIGGARIDADRLLRVAARVRQLRVPLTQPACGSISRPRSFAPLAPIPSEPEGVLPELGPTAGTGPVSDIRPSYLVFSKADAESRDLV